MVQASVCHLAAPAAVAQQSIGIEIDSQLADLSCIVSIDVMGRRFLHCSFRCIPTVKWAVIDKYVRQIPVGGFIAWHRGQFVHASERVAGVDFIIGPYLSEITLIRAFVFRCSSLCPSFINTSFDVGDSRLVRMCQVVTERTEKRKAALSVIHV